MTHIKYRLGDIVMLRGNDANVLGLVSKIIGENTYLVLFQMHSNLKQEYFSQSMTVSGDDIKPVKIDFSNLHKVEQAEKEAEENKHW